MDLRFRYILPVFFAIVANAQNVLTGGYDNARTNSDPAETKLLPRTLSKITFGKLFSLPVDGQIYAQPLYQRNLNIGGATHNVVFIATEHNSIYAFDADIPATPLWTVNLGPAVPSTAYDDPHDGPYTDISPEIGITGTPVIDPFTSTLYVVAATVENGQYYFRLHALDTATGREKFGAPQLIQASVKGVATDSVDGVVSFNAKQSLQRPALLLVNGVVYVAFGSHGDSYPWHGWIVGYKASDVNAQTAVFNATPNTWGGAIWQSGRGLSADAQGNIFTVTSNGGTDEVTEFSDNVLKLNPANLAVADWFAPSDVQTIDMDDEDLGSSGAALIPGTSLLITGGKEGIAYLLNQANLGQLTQNDTQIPQRFQAANVGVFNMAVWNNVFFILGGNSPLAAYPFSGGSLATTPSSQSSEGFDVPYNGITVSSNGTTAGTGIVWMVTADSYPLPANGTLHAYDASDLSSELWNSSIQSDRDSLGAFTKFVNPTVADGKVFLPSGINQIAVYGMLSSAGFGGAATPVVTGLVNAASYAAGALAPGEIVAIFGQNLGPQQLVLGSLDSSGDLGTAIAGMQVTFNGVPAPLLYASSAVMAAVVPFEVSSTSEVDVQVSYDGTPSVTRTFGVATGAPGLFTVNESGSGQAAIINQDYSLNSSSNPAHPGDWVAVYATGGGATNPPDETGAIAQGAAQANARVTATIGGRSAEVLYAGDAPGEIAGAMQVNLRVPAGKSGDLPVVITVDGIASQGTATVAIQ